MSRLPVIAGFGGINSAGRSSSNNSYKRIIIDVLDTKEQQNTILSLASMMGLVQYENGKLLDSASNDTIDAATACKKYGQFVRDNTLLRKIGSEHFDVDAMPFQQRADVSINANPVQFTVKNRSLPNQIPANWQVETVDGRNSKVTIKEGFELLFPDSKAAKVSTAAQLPLGMNPGELYASRNHPRGLQMTVYAASDAIQSMGIDWQTISDNVRPDQIAVYACSSMGQLDNAGTGGLMKAAGLGKRATSKQLPLGFAEMPADFVNAYILGSAGSTGGTLGACASFLYNLEHAVHDIQSGKRRVVVVGTSEAPITPEIMEGYRTMGALADDEALLELDQKLGLSSPDYSRACRPFGYNCGFTIGESSQFVVLMDDELALELGAQIYGAIPDVFINADGHKKSISSPGIGNYLTLGKAAALAKRLIGQEALQRRTYIHAHGTGTPQNRVTESHVFNEIAKAFSIEDWKVSSIKCYVGHSLGAAAGDQLSLALGTWQYGYIPGIFTLDQLAEDVHQTNLSFSQQHNEVGTDGIDATFLNSKGFGGNNATALVLGPHTAQHMLLKKHGQQTINQYLKRNEAVAQKSKDYDLAATQGQVKPIYKFGHNVLEGDDLTISEESIQIPGFENEVDLNPNHSYDDYSIS